jgi:hypothetical protein
MSKQISKQISKQRRSIARRLALSLVAAVLLVPVHAPSASANAVDAIGESTLEVVILRPFGFFSSVAGFAFFLPAAVLTSPSGMDSVKDAWRTFVVEPGEYVYQRPWRDF